MSNAKPHVPTPVAALLPHTGAMRLIDELLGYDQHSLRVALRVCDQPPFGDGHGRVPAYLGIEYMAQAIAVFSGLEMRAQGLPPKIGLLIGARRYESQLDHFLAGQLLNVGIRLVMRDEAGICVFGCEIFDAAGVSLARAEIKAYRPDDIHRFLLEDSAA